MNKISTAEQFHDSKDPLCVGMYNHAIQEMMIEFAKMHLEAFKQKICEVDVSSITEWVDSYNGNIIISSHKIDSLYPLENVK